MPLNVEKTSASSKIINLADVCDIETVKSALEQELQSAKDSAEVRNTTIKFLQNVNRDGREKIALAIKVRPRSANLSTSAYAYLTDQLVLLAYYVATKWLHPVQNPTKSERIAMLAVGGYGRNEMAPFSDVDLLFLTPYKQTAWSESVVESILYILWDLHLKVGHSVRTIDDCIRLGREDYTIRTSLLEKRYLVGDHVLSDELDTRLWGELFDNTGPEFVEAKLKERDIRHQQNGKARYVVEPNIKEGKGGLRDIQNLYWISKYLYHARTSSDLIDHGVFNKKEHSILSKAEAFLWNIRCHMHLISNRAVEILSFDLQVEVADALGYKDSESRRAVEHFMQDYFRYATDVGDLTRIFLTALEEQHVKESPTIGQRIIDALTFKSDGLGSEYKITHGRLNVAKPRIFFRDPLNILRLFEEALRTETLIHPNAMRLIVRNLTLIDDNMRNSPEAGKIFMDLLLKYNNPERALRRMNELGVLGAFIPEFGRIIAMMQFNMYHSYTVDEHTIQCISNLAKIENGKLEEELPVASMILEKGVNRRVLYLALLLHDIGKGLPEDHSIVGAEIARKIAPRFGLDQEECELVEWLVLNHLLMSDVAQKRDLSDPRTVRDFANAAQRRTRLKLLTVLTVCDIRGVGPETWNNWKAMLLRDLYFQTRELLRNGQQESANPTRENDAKIALQDVLQDWKKEDITKELERHFRPYWLGLDTDTHRIFADLTRNVQHDKPVHHIEQDISRDATRACFVMPDHPGIFARFAGALALAGANVVDARTYTSSDGLATAVFWIQTADGKPYEKNHVQRLNTMISCILKGEVLAKDRFRAKDKIKKREREFIVPTTVEFDNDGSDMFTIIEVEARDRPGLLFDLSRTLTDCGVSISSAIIATYGEQAVDAFYVKDIFGTKIVSESKKTMIMERLQKAVEQGMKAAKA